jgi:acid phosphatase type 7
MRVTRKATAFIVASLLLASNASAATVTRGPYLQTPTTGSIIVRWRTDVATDSRVAYGAAPGSLTSFADDATVTTEHVVTVNSLSADTQYYYAVGTTGESVIVGDDADHYFRTHPVPGPAQPMRIWVTGDGGFANADGMAVRDAYGTYNGVSSADLWLLLGDNAYLLGNDANYQAALFDMHHDMLRNTPVWSTFGNHEDFSSNDLAGTGPYFDMFSFPTAGESGGVASGTEAYYSFDYANVHFIVLDSEGPSLGVGNPAPNSPMMLWLVSDLQATTADWVIAFFHRPPYSKGLLHDSDTEQGEINIRTNVLPTLESYGVDLVLTGHSHSYERSYLLDGHYGLSPTFDLATHALDSGDGAPAGDGAYRKATIGTAPNEGEVHVVCGSSSEVRMTTLNHPAHYIGLLELGSMVIDIDGDTLDAKFLNSNVQITDSFRIVKGPACPPAPSTGCADGPKGKIIVKKHASDNTKDKMIWKWQNGTIQAADIPSPIDQTDLAVCLYDVNGKVLGSALPKGALWTANSKGDFQLKDLTAANGMQKVKIKFSKPFIKVKGKGSGLTMPALPLTTPVTAQLVNLDNGACWESEFTTFKASDDGKFKAQIP